MSSIRLRKASLDDLPSLVELEYAAFPGDWISRRSWRDLLTSPAATVTVALSREEIVGSCVLLTNNRTRVGRVYSLAVASKVRRQGVARFLLEMAAVQAVERGASLCRLETRIDNKPAQRLFEALGFRVFASAAQYYQDGTDALRYELRLVDEPRRVAGAR